MVVMVRMRLERLFQQTMTGGVVDDGHDEHQQQGANYEAPRLRHNPGLLTQENTARIKSKPRLTPSHLITLVTCCSPEEVQASWH
jgi:hypothetical protein